MGTIGFPATLCGQHSYYGRGCSECCFGHIVMANQRNWEEISGSLDSKPEVFNSAVGTAVSRMERIQPGITEDLLATEQRDLKRHLPLYVDSHEKLDQLMGFDGRVLEIVSDQQLVMEDQKFTEVEALGDTGYLRSVMNQRGWEYDNTLVGRVGFILASAISNQVRAVGRAFNDEELLERITYMANPKKDRFDLPCPLIQKSTGKCQVYADRPDICKATGVYYPEEISCTGCGPNLLYCSLHNSKPLSKEGYTIGFGSLYVDSRDGLPLEFLLVKEMAARNPNFADDPIGFAARINKPARHRH